MRPLDASPPVREVWADELLDRLTPFMSALSVVFLLVVLGWIESKLDVNVDQDS